MENNYPKEPARKDSNKIYFLIAVIVALLGTNAYLFFKDKKSNERIVTLSDERSRMETEIDKIEAELDKANNTNLTLSTQMKEEQEMARDKISQLREQLKRGQLTKGQLEKAQKDIQQLRYFVSKYSADIEELKKENAALTTERDSLITTVSSVNAKATELEKQNEDLNTKVKTAAAIKVGNMSIVPLRVRNSGKETDVSRANAAKKLRVNFTVADNAIAEHGMHDIYIRIIDPNGNLMISDNSALFTADGEELQYTYKTAIEFANDGKVYTVDWTNPNKFEKGMYTVVLYSDGYTMGKANVNLK
jgi:predicted RNase H-like nuclease (RuvC/YqgF family)